MGKIITRIRNAGESVRNVGESFRRKGEAKRAAREAKANTNYKDRVTDVVSRRRKGTLTHEDAQTRLKEANEIRRKESKSFSERFVGGVGNAARGFGNINTGLNIRPPDMGSFGMISPPADWMVHGPSAPSMQRKPRSSSRRRREPREPVEDYDPYESQHIMMGGIPKHMQRWM